ncbi:hypothetical protein [Aliivibrio fischeri]|uniref:hypothetical protein n=1 Tax=Aliivibrio fischeri TaxID=668 RepID=UPI0012D988F6|nr:hypothetical protein [Aliivibrio fischeri]MUJ20401.1 hypothetical protein [Aliivibrio fischeri]
MRIIPVLSKAKTMFLFFLVFTQPVMAEEHLNHKFFLTQDAANEIMMYHDGVITNQDGTTSYLGCGINKKIAYVYASRSALNHLKNKSYISSTETLSNKMTNEIEKTQQIRLNNLIIIEEAYFSNNKAPYYCQIAILPITDQHE